MDCSREPDFRKWEGVVVNRRSCQNANENEMDVDEVATCHEIVGTVDGESGQNECSDDVYAEKENEVGVLKRHENVVYDCPVCEHVFIDLITFHEHVTGHPEKVCKECGRSCKSMQNIVNHFRRHRPEQSIKCPNCDMKFTTRACVETHLRIKHNEGCKAVCNKIMVIKCNKCIECMYFKSIEGFRYHLYLEHSITVKDNNKARKHMTLHYDATLLRCKMCTRKLRDTTSLSIHEKTHREKYRYCYMCGKDVDGQILRHFQQSHPGKPSYKCLNHCNKFFTNYKELMSHKK